MPYSIDIGRAVILSHLKAIDEAGRNSLRPQQEHHGRGKIFTVALAEVEEEIGHRIPGLTPSQPERVAIAGPEVALNCRRHLERGHCPFRHLTRQFRHSWIEIFWQLQVTPLDLERVFARKIVTQLGRCWEIGIGIDPVFKLGAGMRRGPEPIALVAHKHRKTNHEDRPRRDKDGADIERFEKDPLFGDSVIGVTAINDKRVLGPPYDLCPCPGLGPGLAIISVKGHAAPTQGTRRNPTRWPDTGPHDDLRIELDLCHFTQADILGEARQGLCRQNSIAGRSLRYPRQNQKEWNCHHQHRKENDGGETGEQRWTRPEDQPAPTAAPLPIERHITPLTTTLPPRLIK